MREFAKIGTCQKCGTTNSELFQYRSGFFICRGALCWDEEVERDTGRHLMLNKKLEDYRKIIQNAGG